VTRAFLEAENPEISGIAAGDRHQKVGKVRSLREWVVVVIVSIAIAFTIRSFFLGSYSIPSESMYPKLTHGDRVFVNKFAYRFSDIERGDIVVLRRPAKLEADASVKDLIKRVIGLPGDTVEFRDGKVWVNNVVLEERYLLPEVTTYGKTGGNLMVLSADEVLVLGDNREGSQDGRYFGPVKISSIVGRAFVQYWPINKFESL
jgi:signal peptidase I